MFSFLRKFIDNVSGKWVVEITTKSNQGDTILCRLGCQREGVTGPLRPVFVRGVTLAEEVVKKINIHLQQNEQWTACKAVATIRLATPEESRVAIEYCCLRGSVILE